MHWILRHLAPPLRKPGPQEQRSIVRTLFHTCPACGKDLAGHAFWRLASVILDSANRRLGQELGKLISERQFGRAAQFQEWKGNENEREYYVVHCPNQRPISLVTVVSKTDLWSDDYVESTEVLDL